MKLIILGANGRTGKLVLHAALENGRDVIGVVQSADKTPGIRNDLLRMAVGIREERTF